MTSLTTGTGLATDAGNIRFDQSGGGKVTFTTVTTNTTSTTEGQGDILLTNAAADLEIGTAGAVTAGGLGNISYTTTGSGSIILIGTTAALADDVDVTAAVSVTLTGTIQAADVDIDAQAGSINGAGLVTATSSTWTRPRGSATRPASSWRPRRSRPTRTPASSTSTTRWPARSR